MLQRQMIRLKFEEDGRGDERGSLTEVMVQHDDEQTTDWRSLFGSPLPPSLYFLVWPSCVKAGSASYLGSWTAVWSGSSSQAPSTFPRGPLL